MASQKVALVTGAGSGVGKAAALALSRDGFAVVLAGRRADKLHEAAKELDGANLIVPTDVREPASIAALFAKTKETFGRLDLLFNNAGVRVDLRGSGESTGLLFDEYAQQEQDDGVEVIAWLAAQPWCNG